MAEADQGLYSEGVIEKELGVSASADLDPLLDKIGNARFVLLGEGSHGTHEYYAWRTAISKRLIEEKGFTFIAVEGDWPDCYNINRYVKGHDDAGSDAASVLKKFSRWPTWMWANWETVALAEWMREHNDSLPEERKIGFYGLDVYSLWESLNAIINYLRDVDPEAADLALKALRCFAPYKEGVDYARAIRDRLSDRSDEVVQLLKEIDLKVDQYNDDREAPLNAEINTNVVASAEEYYRSMVSRLDQSWNIRDAHMATTLNALMKFHGPRSKAIIWEHNSHIGDARFTSMAKEGLQNLGQLIKEEHETAGVFTAGLTSYEGEVIAADKWGGAIQKMSVPPARNESVEAILHTDSTQDRLILMARDHLNEKFNRWLDHRAIGVVYQPEYEQGNYVPTLMPRRYDAVLYFDKTSALHPLHITPDGDKVPDTYPFGV